MQLKIIGTSSLATMPELDHSGGHCHCNHCVLNTAPQPHEPKASVCIDKSEAVLSAGWCNMLSLFHDCRKVCHHIKSDLRKFFVQPGKEVYLLEFGGCHVHSSHKCPTRPDFCGMLQQAYQ